MEEPQRRSRGRVQGPRIALTEPPQQVERLAQMVRVLSDRCDHRRNVVQQVTCVRRPGVHDGTHEIECPAGLERGDPPDDLQQTAPGVGVPIAVRRLKSAPEGFDGRPAHRPESAPLPVHSAGVHQQMGQRLAVGVGKDPFEKGGR